MTIEEKWNYQQTDLGRISNQVAENLKQKYEAQFRMRKDTIKSGRIEALVNERTNEKKFYER